MKRPLVKNTLRWMLAAWMLSATVFASPTIVHSHSEGDRPHHHDWDGNDLEAICESPSPAALQDGHEGESYLSAADFHQHGCFRLLGTVKYWPSPTEPCGPQGKSPCNWEMTIAAAAAAGLRASSNGAEVSHWGLARAADPFVDCVCPAGEVTVRSCGVAVASPLCDRARHERSGVQLA